MQEIANDQSIVVEKGGEAPNIQQNKRSEIEPIVAPNPIENKAEIEQVSPPSPPPIPPRPNKPLEPEGKTAHDDKQATLTQSETKSEPAVPTQTLSPEISEPLPAKVDTVIAPKVQTLTSEEVHHSKAQATPLVKGSTFYGAIQDVADSLREL